MKTITALAIATLKLHEYVQIDVPDYLNEQEIAELLRVEAELQFAQHVQLSNGLKLDIDVIDSEEMG